MCEGGHQKDVSVDPAAKLPTANLRLHRSALSLKFNYHRHGIFFLAKMFSLSERDLWSPRWLRSLLLVPNVLKKDSLDMKEFIKARFRGEQKTDSQTEKLSFQISRSTDFHF